MFSNDEGYRNTRTVECGAAASGVADARGKRVEKGINARAHASAPAARNKRALSHAHVVQNHRDYGES